MLKILIIIPVLNEENNVILIYNMIRKSLKIKFDILFIDDNSTDKTRENIINLKKKYKNILFIKRPKRLGIGSAHKAGLKIGYKKKYQFIITMDCDGTHNPKYINKMLAIAKLTDAQLITTNRFLKKKSLKDWSAWRIILTTLRHILIKFLLKINFDSSGAFRLYKTKEIKIKDILFAKNESYSFFWESIFLLSKKYKIKEIPINLPGRLSGSSKMNLNEIFKALNYLIIFFIYNRVNFFNSN
jgi:dolichol-phosphate mannosyltransferase